MLVKRSISLAGHRTSIALEPEFWAEVERLAKDKGVSLAAFVRALDEGRAAQTNLASELRLAVLADINRQLVRQQRGHAALIGPAGPVGSAGPSEG